jgi:Ca2+-binding RTX toxin-like protein
LKAWANLRIELTEVGYRDDYVRTRDGHDRIFTYGGDDTVEAGGGNDYVHGGAGNDRISGGAGYDLLEGGTGNDRLTGGTERDTFAFTTGDGHDVITDFTFWTDRIRINGEDAFNFAGMAALDGVSVTATAAGVWLTYGAGDTVLFEDLAPRAAGTQGGKVTGTDGTDVLVGSDAQDDLRGHNGADYLVDGGGRDFLRGGNGKDLFVLVRDGARDVITDFQADKDRIDLTAWEVALFEDLDISVDYHLNGDWAGYGHIVYADEVLRLDGMDAAMLAALTSDVIEI